MTGRTAAIPATTPLAPGNLTRLSRLRSSLPALPGGMRVRVLVWFVVLLAGSSVVTAFGLREILTSQLSDDVTFELTQEAEELQVLADGTNPTTGQPFGGDAAAIFDTFFVRDVPDKGEAFYSMVAGTPYKKNNVPASGSLFDDPAVLTAWRTATGPTFGRTGTEAGPVRWLAFPLAESDPPGAVFVVAWYEALRSQQIDQTIQLMLAVLIAAFLLGLIPAWFAAGRAIAPLRTLTAAARDIEGSDLSKRISTQGPDEISQLAATLNSMLERLEAAFRSQREFLDDVGHELRTPMTIMRGHLELLEEDPVERTQTVEVVLGQLDRMNRYVGDLLLIARAKRPDFLRPGPVEVAAFVRSLPALVRPLGDRDWRFVPVGPAVIHADADRLTQASLNLASNAIRYTNPGDVIELGASVEDGYARLWVRDEGAGVAPDEQQRIFRRFARGRGRGANESDGTGLGLAIVDAIAVAHGGWTELESTVGEGSTFSLIIPFVPPPTEVAP